MIRILSAAVLITFVILTVWVLPAWATVALSAVVAAVSAAEVAGLAARVQAPIPAWFVTVAAALLTIAFARHDPDGIDGNHQFLAAALLGLLLAAGLTTLRFSLHEPNTLPRMAIMIATPIYVGLPLGAIAWVQGIFGPATTTWLIATIAVSDSAQYYTGRLMGRTKLAPAISPAKTIEGAIGGLVAAGLTGFFLGPLALPSVAAGAALGIAIVLALFGILGDLFESLLKRSAGTKDASALIPGHGGALDRIDSYLFAAPVFYLLLRYAV